MEDENCVAKTRSFRDEDYNNRRVFLRSYPLQWEEEEEEEAKRDGDDDDDGSKKKIRKSETFLKNRLIAIINWSEGKCVVLRKIKDKVAVYLLACHPFPFRFKSSSKLITLS